MPEKPGDYERTIKNLYGKYECDGCGACCKHFTVWASVPDALREPRIAAKAADDLVVLTEECGAQREDGAVLISGIGESKPCDFLLADNSCDIYPTRPDVCVRFLPGCDQCQEAREACGLPLLRPKPV